MLLPRLLTTTADATVDDAVDGLTTLAWQSGEAPTLWLYWLVDDVNPFQRVLFSRLPSTDVLPVPAPRAAVVDEVLDALPRDTPAVLHLHWLHHVLRAADDERTAARAVDAYLARLDGWVARGVRLVWTVHNALPHDARWRDEERRLAVGVAARA
jgi:beta-1,4-mannosyltransferase